MKKLILSTVALLPAEEESLDQHFDVLRLRREKDPEAAIQAHRQDIVGIASGMMKVSRQLIEALPNLEIIATNSVGTDHIDLVAARERGVAVTNTPGVLTDDTADTALALLLATARRICEGDIYVRVGKWLNGDMPLGVSLSGKKAGIVGLGRIGQAIAKRCEAFGMEILYHGPRKKDVPYHYVDDVHALAQAADFMILACPGGPATAGLVDGPVLESLGPKGILINISRGSVVDEPALIAALQNRRILAAGLDVYAHEPHVPEAFISMDNVVLLPHIGSATVETRTVMGRLVVDNLLAHFNGQPLKTPVSA
jgi:lactate dehydrogenase-like 2-hydroxyacid dehydrogenase